MRVAAIWLVLLAAACLAAGLYGAIHNQVSYTVSRDYFHSFKFRQFQIPPDLQNRVGASWVGFQAAWWMGLIVGSPVILLGRRLYPGWSLVRPVLESFLALTLTALLVGGAALEMAYMMIDASHLPSFWIPREASDPVAFSRAGALHNASYAGGVIGILSGCGWLILRSKMRPAGQASQGA